MLLCTFARGIYWNHELLMHGQKQLENPVGVKFGELILILNIVHVISKHEAWLPPGVLHPYSRCLGNLAGSSLVDLS